MYTEFTKKKVSEQVMLAVACSTFVVITLLHEGLTHIHSQKKSRLHFGDSFAVTDDTKLYAGKQFLSSYK